MRAAAQVEHFRLSHGQAHILAPSIHAGETVSVEYKTEYSTDKIEMHTGAVKPGQRVLLIDDLIATGGTLGMFEHDIGSVGRFTCPWLANIYNEAGHS